MPIMDGGTDLTDELIEAGNAVGAVATKGDLIVGSAADNLAVLAVGTDGKVLTTDAAEATGLKWATPTAGSGDVATDTIFDAAGDLVQGTGANTAARLAIGTAGQVLTVNPGATAVEWDDAASGGGGGIASSVHFSQPTDGITRASTTLGALSTPWTDSVTVASGDDVRYDISISFQIGSNATFYAALVVDGTIVNRVRVTPGATNYETQAIMSGIVTGLSAASHTFEIYCGTHGGETVTINTTVDTGTTLGTAGSLAADGVSSMMLMVISGDAAALESGAATDGQVLTADGAGGAAWENAGDPNLTARFYYAELHHFR